MNEQKTLSWLKQLKIATNHINETQIKNGYLFGIIFQKLNLSKSKKFTNNHDLPCIFQNYKHTKDLLYENFKIDFPANQIIYKGNQLLQTIRDACIAYQTNKKQNTLNEIKKKYLPKNQQQKINSSINNNNTSIKKQGKTLISNNNTLLKSTLNNNTLNNSLNNTKLPKKILDIQKKLQKFKYEKTHQQLINLQTRRRQIQQINDAVQQHRHFQMSKLRMNHQQTKQLQKRVNQLYKYTQGQKKARIQKQQQFFRFMKSKKDNFQATLRNQQEKTFKNGLEDFQLNCMRQGIQLQHDPTKEYVPKSQNFNAVVMMERIKDNIKNLQRQRKQRKKRQNNKAIETLQANAKSEKLWEEVYLVEDLEKKMTKQFNNCQKIHLEKLVQHAQTLQIAEKLKNKQQKPLPIATEQQKQAFQAQLRSNRLVFYDKQIERLQKKQKRMRNIAEQVLQALFYTTIISQESQKNLNFTYTQWKSLQKIFIDFNYSQSSKSKKVPLSKKVIEPQKLKVFIKYMIDIKQTLNNKQNQQRQLAELINKIIDNIYPKKQLPEKSNVPLYMPVRIGFTGSKLSGKTTQVKKLLTKYNSLILIDPKKILVQALELAKPAPVIDDPKKKKDSKKPEQQTPQRLEFKKFGQSILQEIKAELVNPDDQIQVQKLSFKYFIKAIKFKLQKSFQQKSKKQVLQTYNKKKQEQQQRIKNFAQIQEEKNKKKDSKKGAVVAAQIQSPTFNELFYIQGFILDNVDLNSDNLKEIQRQLNGFISFDQRFNQQAQKLKQSLALFIPITKAQKPDNLNKGFFNILIDLDATNQNLQQRNQNRKIDPQTNQVYHTKYNPPPTDIKGLVQRLVEIKPEIIDNQQKRRQDQQKRQNYYKQFGDDKQKISAYKKIEEKTIEDTSNQIFKVFEQILKIQYERIKQLPIQQVEEFRQEKVQQNGQDNQLTSNENKPQIEATQTAQNNNQQQNKPQSNKNLISFLNNPQLLKKFCQLTTKYQQRTIDSLQKLSLTRQHFQNNFLSQQKLFVEIINRPDDKAGKILTFQDNYNKLLDQKANILNDKSAINHLIQKLDEMYDNLWVNLDKKKNQAISHRKKFQSSEWMNEQAKQLVEKFKQLLQNQLNYLVDILAFILCSQLALDGKNSQPVIDYLTLGISKQLQPIQSISSPERSQEGISPRLNFYFRQTQQCLQSIQSWLQKKQAQSKIKLSQQLEQLAKIIINKQKIFINSVINNLNQRNFSLVSQELCYYKVLVNKMDDWIIQGIKQQNDFIYNIYKQIKFNIQKLSKIYLKDLFPPEITYTIKSIDYLTPYAQYIPMPTSSSSSSSSNHFDFSSFKIFLQQLRCLNEFKSQSLKISFILFKQYFIKRKKSKLLNQIYLKLDFDKMQQYLVIDEQFNFKQLAISMLLYNQKVVDEDQMISYVDKVNNIKHQSSKYQKQDQKQQQITHLDIDQLNIQLLFNDLNLSIQQAKALNHLVFDIVKSDYTNKVQLKQLIQILKVFSSLQVYKYGDCIMELNEKKQ